MMEIAILILLTSLSNCLCVAVGMAVGQKLTGQRSDCTMQEKPISKKEAKAMRAEHRKQQENLETMLHNIDVYDGTPDGQRHVSD